MSEAGWAFLMAAIVGGVSLVTALATIISSYKSTQNAENRTDQRIEDERVREDSRSSLDRRRASNRIYKEKLEHCLNVALDYTTELDKMPFGLHDEERLQELTLEWVKSSIAAGACFAPLGIGSVLVAEFDSVSVTLNEQRSNGAIPVRVDGRRTNAVAAVVGNIQKAIVDMDL